MDPRQVDSGEVILNMQGAVNNDHAVPQDEDQHSTADTRSETGSTNERADDISHHFMINREITSTLRDVVLELGNLKQQIEQVKSVGQESGKRSSCTNNSVKTVDQSANAANIDFQCISGQYTGTPFSGGQPTCYRVEHSSSEGPYGGYRIPENEDTPYSQENSDERPDRTLQRHTRQTGDQARDNSTRDVPVRCPPVKISSFSGSEDWATLITQFEVIANRFRWSEEEMLDQLLPRIEGPAAQFVFSQLRQDTLNSYKDLTYELRCRFQPIETARSFASKFSRRSQRQGEKLEDYAADLKMLYDKVHSYRDRRTRQEDLVRRFLDGLLDDEMKFELEFNKDPRTIDEAVYYAVTWVQLKGINRRKRNEARKVYEESDEEPDFDDRQALRRVNSDKKPDTNTEPTSAESVTDMLKEVLARLDKLEERKNKAIERAERKKTIICFNCSKQGHYARECTDRTDTRVMKNNTDDLNGQGPIRSA